MDRLSRRRALIGIGGAVLAAGAAKAQTSPPRRPVGVPSQQFQFDVSIDNAIAMAAVAKNDMTLIVIGLMISVPVIMLGAAIIAGVLDRFPWVGVVGAGLIGVIAGGVIADEGRVLRPDGKGGQIEIAEPGTIAAWLDATIPDAEWVMRAVGAGVVLVVGLYLSRRNKSKAA